MELISKELAIKLVGGYSMKTGIVEAPYTFAWTTLEDMPTVDAEPVVRCSECISHNNRTNRCDTWNANTPDNGHCFRGCKYKND